jgi:hypothetical protein
MMMKPFTPKELKKITEDDEKLYEFLTDYGWRGLLAIIIFVPWTYCTKLERDTSYRVRLSCSKCILCGKGCSPGQKASTIRAYGDLIKALGRYPNDKDRIE